MPYMNNTNTEGIDILQKETLEQAIIPEEKIAILTREATFGL